MDRPEFTLSFRQIKEHPDCDKTDVEVYGYIYWLACLKQEKCIAGNKTLSELVGVSTGTVMNSLTRLEKAGFIKRIYEEGNPSKLRHEILPLLRVGIMPHTIPPHVARDTPSRGTLGTPHVAREHSINKSIEKEHLISADAQKEVDSDTLKEILAVPINEDGDMVHVKQRKSSAKYPHAKEIFALFPHRQRSWDIDTTQLKHAELLHEKGVKHVSAALKFHSESRDHQFCPEIDTPHQLSTKWLKLVAFKKKYG